MFKSTNIRNLVMVAVEKMINEVQQKYDARCDEIHREAERKQMEAREEAVESIISKFR